METTEKTEKIEKSEKVYVAVLGMRAEIKKLGHFEFFKKLGGK